VETHHRKSVEHPAQCLDRSTYCSFPENCGIRHKCNALSMKGCVVREFNPAKQRSVASRQRPSVLIDAAQVKKRRCSRQESQRERYGFRRMEAQAALSRMRRKSAESGQHQFTVRGFSPEVAFNRMLTASSPLRCLGTTAHCHAGAREVSYGFRLNPALFAGLIRSKGAGTDTHSGRWTCIRCCPRYTGIGRNAYHHRRRSGSELRSYFSPAAAITPSVTRRWKSR
jgi:hypothetical protein